MREVGFDDASIGSGANGGAVGTLPHQEGNSSEDDTLTSPRLTRDDGEVGRELDGQLVDEHKVSNAETLKHN